MQSTAWLTDETCPYRAGMHEMNFRLPGMAVHKVCAILPGSLVKKERVATPRRRPVSGAKFRMVKFSATTRWRDGDEMRDGMGG